MCFTKLYHYSAVTKRMDIHSRDDENKIVETVEGVDIYQSTAIGRALDRVFKDGIAEGKRKVINAVNKTIDSVEV